MAEEISFPPSRAPFRKGPVSPSAPLPHGRPPFRAAVHDFISQGQGLFGAEQPVLLPVHGLFQFLLRHGGILPAKQPELREIHQEHHIFPGKPLRLQPPESGGHRFLRHVRKDGGALPEEPPLLQLHAIEPAGQYYTDHGGMAPCPVCLPQGTVCQFPCPIRNVHRL